MPLTSAADPIFRISLSQWCYHRAIFGDSRSDYDWFIRTLHSEPDAVLRGDMDPRDIVVKAKAHGFDDHGSELRTDFTEAMRILLSAGFRGYASVEYEGDSMSEDEGVEATRQLLERVRSELTPEFAE